MWSGSADTIPDGWALCDGQNGTPDLRDRFIIGAGGSYSVGSAGGNASQTVTLSGQTGATTLTIEQMPNHAHTMYAYATNATSGKKFMAYNSNYPTTMNTWGTGGSQSHAHSLSGEVSVNTLPPYYALCFIMKL